MLLVLLGTTRQTALAFVETGSVGSIDYRVMAPDWICRGEVVSVLIVVSVDDRADAAYELVATLTPPGTGFEAAAGAVVERRLTIAPGQVERFSFTGWKARVDADLGRFTFGLRLGIPRYGGGGSVTIPVDTIRGAAVPPGIWSIVVPIAISLLALPVFALLLGRTARPGAWKRAVDLEIIPAEEPWWKT